ncbi:MAG TPA: hypothetical protein VJK02_09270 [Anaerolineales bacterium]|nr:hypothetical protein [Anaerolineales bacterium]
METIGKCTRLAAVLVWIAALAVAGLAVPAGAQAPPITPPDLSVCDNITDACDAPANVCKAGFQVTLTGFTPAATSTSGKAEYVYEICEPAAGTCSLDATISCLDNGDCTPGQNNFGTCNRQCAVDDFHGLSHFDVAFPLLADTSCLSGNNEVTGTCACKTGSSQTCSVDTNITIGDGSCFPNTCVGADTCVGTGQNKMCSVTGVACNNSGQCTQNLGACSQTGNACQTDANCGPTPVAKCDNTNLNPGDCVVMTLQIAGETSGLGKGATVVVDKEATVCTSACMQGPSCDRCDGDEDGRACLTRTIGFWGTHPWITNDYDPVTVCGKTLDCSGADDGKSNPSCTVGICTSIMEGLGSIPSELSSNQPYVSMIKQLTAAKLNLSATADLVEGATCASFRHDGRTIQDWISTCEGLCGANKSTISGSGCIEALNAFNNSQDVGFAQTPPPFDRPSVDDHGNVSGADPSYFTAAQKNKLVIGKNITSGSQCQ